MCVPSAQETRGTICPSIPDLANQETAFLTSMKPQTFQTGSLVFLGKEHHSGGKFVQHWHCRSIASRRFVCNYLPRFTNLCNIAIFDALQCLSTLPQLSQNLLFQLCLLCSTPCLPLQMQSKRRFSIVDAEYQRILKGFIPYVGCLLWQICCSQKMILAEVVHSNTSPNRGASPVAFQIITYLIIVNQATSTAKGDPSSS